MNVRSSMSRSSSATALKAVAVALVAVVLAGTGAVSGMAEASAQTTAQAKAVRLARYRRHLARLGSAATVSRGVPRGWSSARVSWYGPGFYGRGMAGGGKLGLTSMIVAHKTLPFGTKVQFWYNGKSIIVPVKDRGPYVAGREFDLGPGTAIALGIDKMGVAKVRYRILGR